MPSTTATPAPRRRAPARTQAERSKSARDRRAAERTKRTQALSAALRALTVDPTDPAVPDLLDAMADALTGASLDLHQSPGEPGQEDGGIRSAVRALHGAVARLLGDDAIAAAGAISQALEEVHNQHLGPT